MAKSHEELLETIDKIEKQVFELNEIISLPVYIFEQPSFDENLFLDKKEAFNSIIFDNNNEEDFIGYESDEKLKKKLENMEVFLSQKCKEQIETQVKIHNLNWKPRINIESDVLATLTDYITSFKKAIFEKNSEYVERLSEHKQSFEQKNQAYLKKYAKNSKTYKKKISRINSLIQLIEDNPYKLVVSEVEVAALESQKRKASKAIVMIESAIIEEDTIQQLKTCFLNIAAPHEDYIFSPEILDDRCQSDCHIQKMGIELRKLDNKANALISKIHKFDFNKYHNDKKEYYELENKLTVAIGRMTELNNSRTHIKNKILQRQQTLLSVSAQTDTQKEELEQVKLKLKDELERFLEIFRTQFNDKTEKNIKKVVVGLINELIINLKADYLPINKKLDPFHEKLLAHLGENGRWFGSFTKTLTEEDINAFLRQLFTNSASSLHDQIIQLRMLTARIETSSLFNVSNYQTLQITLANQAISIDDKNNQLQKDVANLPNKIITKLDLFRNQVDDVLELNANDYSVEETGFNNIKTLLTNEMPQFQLKLEDLLEDYNEGKKNLNEKSYDELEQLVNLQAVTIEKFNEIEKEYHRLNEQGIRLSNALDQEYNDSKNRLTRALDSKIRHAWAARLTHSTIDESQALFKSCLEKYNAINSNQQYSLSILNKGIEGLEHLATLFTTSRFASTVQNITSMEELRRHVLALSVRAQNDDNEKRTLQQINKLLDNRNFIDLIEELNLKQLSQLFNDPEYTFLVGGAADVANEIAEIVDDTRSTLRRNNSRCYEELNNRNETFKLPKLNENNPLKQELSNQKIDTDLALAALKRNYDSLLTAEVKNLPQVKMELENSIFTANQRLNELNGTCKKAVTLEARLNSDAYLTSQEIIETLKKEFRRIAEEKSADIISRYIEAGDAEALGLIRSFIVNPPVKNRIAEENEILLEDDDNKTVDLLNEIDPMLILLLGMIRKFEGINADYINQDLEICSPVKYTQKLINTVENHIHNDHLEDISDNAHWRLTQFIRKHIFKPIQGLKHSISNYFSGDTNRFFTTKGATKTEKEIVELGNEAFSTLSQLVAPPAPAA